MANSAEIRDWLQQLYAHAQQYPDDYPIQADNFMEIEQYVDELELELSESRWDLYRSTEFIEARPYVANYDLSEITIPDGYTPDIGDWIARNPADHTMMWLIPG